MFRLDGLPSSVFTIPTSPAEFGSVFAETADAFDVQQVRIFPEGRVDKWIHGKTQNVSEPTACSICFIDRFGYCSLFKMMTFILHRRKYFCYAVYKEDSMAVFIPTTSKPEKAKDMPKEWSYRQWVDAVKRNPRAIEHFGITDHDLLMSAINANGLAMRHIESPTLEMQMAAIREYNYAVAHIKNPHPKVIIELFRVNPHALLSVKTIPESVQRKLFNAGSYFIKYVQNPILEIQYQAVDLQIPTSIWACKNISKEILDYEHQWEVLNALAQ